ncbi:MAG: hypothetical protein ACRC42_04795, partial [Mycoplasma sp.]
TVTKEEVKKKLEALEILQKDLNQKELDGKKKEEESLEVEKRASEQNKSANEIAEQMRVKQEKVKEDLDKLQPAQVAEFKTFKETPNLNKFGYFVCLLKLENPKPKPEPPKNKGDPPTYNYYKHMMEKYMKPKTPTEVLNDLKGKVDRKAKEKPVKIPRSQMEEWRTALEDKTFNPEQIGRTAQSIFNAICTLTEIFFINEDYMPLKQAAEEAEHQLKIAQETLKEVQEKLSETRKIKAEKEAELEEAKKTIDKLESKLKQCTTRLSNAHTLNSSLGNEKEDWKNKKESLKQFSVNIMGDIWISSGIISYWGAFPKSYREEIIEKWAKKIKDSSIPISYGLPEQNPNNIMRKIIGDEMEIEAWKSQNLPNDNFSADNAIIMAQSRRYPWLIDPQNQALLWLVEKIKQETEILKKTQKKPKNEDKSLIIKRKDGATTAHYCIKTTMTPQLLADVTGDAVQQGKQLIFENAGEVLPQNIASVYKKEFFDNSGQLSVRIGQKTCDVHDNFKFFIITQLPKPHYLPDVCVSLTLVNFTVTEEGLQDQMLNFLVEMENPALNAQRKA